MDTPDTYYTRPMSPPWSKPLDVDRLSEAEADVDFAVPLAELPRLAQLAGLAGEVRGRAHFRRTAGVAVVELNFSGTARLVCQRCLGTMEVGLDAATEVGLIATEAERVVCRRSWSRCSPPMAGSASVSWSRKSCC